MNEPAALEQEMTRLRARVAELERTEAALRESERLLRSVLESAPYPIGVTDENCNIVFLSHAAPGLSTSEVLGQPAWKFLQPSARAVTESSVARVLATGETVTYEVTALSGRIYSISAGPLRHGERIEAVTMVSRDITEHRSLEARLAIADRMAAIGTLAAGVAHEINNPLTYLLASLANLNQALSSEGIDAALRADVLAATEGAERIRNVVSDLSSFSHTAESEPIELDVRPMIESALRMAHSHIHVRAKVVRELGDVPLVRAVDSRLGQVFLNLLVNAAQAISEGNVEANRILVTTRTDEQGRAVVEISDTGSGIAPELRDRIFDPFVTTKPRGVGTGLGLYVCRNIVSSLGGELEMESASGKGSTFRVLLPGAGPSKASVVAAQAAESTTPKGLRVLVADDEPSIANVLRLLLADHEVTVVHDGRAALEALATQEFDVALCDLVIADFGGAELYEELRRLRPGVEARIVFMTGGAFTEQAQKFVERLGPRILSKPFTHRDVLSAVERHHARRDGEPQAAVVSERRD